MRKRNVSRLFGLSALVLTPALINCGGLPGIPGVPLPGDCPSDPSAIAEASWGLSAEIEGKVKGGLQAAANLTNLAAEVEGEVALACATLAIDLGADESDTQPAEDGPGKKAEAACQAAVKALGAVKAKASGSLKVDVVAPKCSASMDAMAECAASCDASLSGGSVEVQCEGGEISGSCGGSCEGECTLEAGAECTGSCSGTCSGSCDANFSGTCSGTCEGTCDGKDSKAECKGKCEGKCSAGGEGKCGGTCGGSCNASCQAKASGECKGTCSGSCDVKMEAPKCSGEVKPPEMSAECKGNCDAKVSANLECTPARVAVKLSGAADTEAAARLQAAIEKNLPALLKVTLGMKGKLEGAVASVKGSVEGLDAVVKGGGEAAIKVGACVAGALKAQVDASVSINVSVSASASASGEAGAG
ncbi:MAG: hypothetical protein KIT72_13495 [Polyangiaceae bacterium]|nr:hypothetical protein [Polyangiaceae bacterium]MCW5791425.1 hypothetical protein [Polyangiaceae bacterium]